MARSMSEVVSRVALEERFEDDWTPKQSVLISPPSSNPANYDSMRDRFIVRTATLVELRLEQFHRGGWINMPEVKCTAGETPPDGLPTRWQEISSVFIDGRSVSAVVTIG